MLNKKVVKDIQSLALKKHRQETGLFIAEGPKIVKELAALAPGQIEKIYATDDWTDENPMTADVEIISVSEAELARISQLQTPNKVLAVLRQFSQAAPQNLRFALYLDSIQDPGNFGTIIRIADWFGVSHIVCSEGCADLYNPKVVQSTMASIARVQVYYEEGQWLQQQKLPLYAAALNGKPLSDFKKTDSGILMIGNESKGLRPELLAMASEQITIPRLGTAESLNAAVATGIILSHLL